MSAAGTALGPVPTTALGARGLTLAYDDRVVVDTLDVDIPDGLDRNDPIVQMMLSTERGRQVLQWLSDNDIPIVIDPGATGAYWNQSEIVLGPGYDNAAVLVHEANHARYTVEGRHADVSNPDRDAYVHGAVDEEVDGTVQQTAVKVSSMEVPVERARVLRRRLFEVHMGDDLAFPVNHIDS